MSGYGGEAAFSSDCTFGLTKRELFAAMAMQGLLACPVADGDANKFASAAVLYADGLLRELERKAGAP